MRLICKSLIAIERASEATAMAGTNFEVGDQVEVTSPNPKLRGTLFPAKIIGKYKNKTKLKVEYHKVKTKFERRISGSLRKAVDEEVDAALIRPPPPRESEHRFKFGEVVDAFFCGGWWEGVITDVVDDATFAVYFRFAKEKFEFEPEELRIHREWVHGSWVPPLQNGDVSDTKKAKAQMKEDFTEGTPVEVCTDEDGFQGAWFAASVVEVVKKDKFLIQYKTIKTDDDKEFLKEEVDAQHIRPCPPQAVVVESYSLNDDVEAFYNDGWWEGVVCRVLRQQRYRVYFKGTNDTLQFEHSRLRPRQIWIDRTWVMASQTLKH